MPSTTVAKFLLLLACMQTWNYGVKSRFSMYGYHSDQSYCTYPTLATKSELFIIWQCYTPILQPVSLYDTLTSTTRGSQLIMPFGATKNKSFNVTDSTHYTPLSILHFLSFGTTASVSLQKKP